MSDGGYCPKCKSATYGVHECPAASRVEPKGDHTTKILSDEQVAKMQNPEPTAREWSAVEIFQAVSTGNDRDLPNGKFVSANEHHKLQSALEAKEAERDKFAGALSIANHERDQARQELASANAKRHEWAKIAATAEMKLTASREREARLREALEKMPASHTVACSTDRCFTGCPVVIRSEALEHGKVGG